MKKRRLLFGVLTASLSLGVGLFAGLKNSNKTYQEADATAETKVSGSFIRIDNIGDLFVGAKVIFVSESGKALDDVWGNPAYVHGGSDGVTMSIINDKHVVTLANSYATIFHVEQGTELGYTLHGKEQDSFAFRADKMRITGEVKNNIYFAHNEKLYYNDNTFENIGEFKDHDIAVEVSKIREASWFVEFSTVEEYGENVRVTHIRNAKSVIDGGYTETELRFTTQYAPRFVSDSGERVYIYREYSPSEYSISVARNPTKTEYVAGEKIDLSGLQFTINSPLHDEVSVNYNNETKNDFTYPEEAYGSGEVIINVHYQGFLFTVTINVSKQQYSAFKIGELADYRGSYMLVYEDKGFNTEIAEDNPAGCKKSVHYDYVLNGRVYVDNSGDYGVLRLDLIKDNDGYHLKSANDKYLSLDPFQMTNSKATVVIEHTNDGERIKSTSGKYLWFDQYEWEFGVGTISENEPVYLFKYSLTTAQEDEIEDFLDDYFEITDVCDEAGTQFLITSANWSTLTTKFNALSDASKAEFVNCSYTEGEYEPKTIEAAMSRYDYIYNKYHNIQEYNYITDFVGRSAAETMQNVINDPSNTLYSAPDNNIVMIVTIAVISSLVGASFIFLKKRKEQ